VTFDAIGGNGATSGAQVQSSLPAGSVVVGVTVEPLLAWLWIGGLVVGLGSVLTFLRRAPLTRRRREAHRHDRVVAVLVLVVALSAFLGTRHPVGDATSAPSPLLGKMPGARGPGAGRGRFNLRSDLGGSSS